MPPQPQPISSRWSLGCSASRSHSRSSLARCASASEQAGRGQGTDRTSTTSSPDRGTAGTAHYRGRSARGCCAGCRRACSPSRGGGPATAAAPSRVSGDSMPWPPVARSTSRSTPTRSSLDHSPATNDSPPPISPRSTRRRNARSSWIPRRCIGGTRRGRSGPSRPTAAGGRAGRGSSRRAAAPAPASAAPDQRARSTAAAVQSSDAKAPQADELHVRHVDILTRRTRLFS